jgi:hypothetical protein
LLPFLVLDAAQCIRTHQNHCQHCLHCPSPSLLPRRHHCYCRLPHHLLCYQVALSYQHKHLLYDSRLLLLPRPLTLLFWIKIPLPITELQPGLAILLAMV